MLTRLPLTILPIEDDGFHLQVSAMINGKEAILILDTGASKTVFDENMIVEFIGEDTIEEEERMSTGLGTTTMRSKKVIIQQIRLQNIELIDYEATLLDLHHVNESYEKLGITSVHGILGGDILLNCNAIINYQKKELILSSTDK